MERPEFGVISTVDSRTKVQDGMSDSWHPAWLLDTGSWACLLQLEELSLDILTSPGKIMVRKFPLPTSKSSEF